MRHRKHHTRLNREVGHRNAVLRNLATALITHGQIETTAVKAKTLRPFVERLITLGRKATLHHRRLAFQQVPDKVTIHKVFEEIAPRYKDRNGGYTRILLSRRRMGDGAEMAFIELIDRPEAAAPAAAPDATAPATA